MSSEQDLDFPAWDDGEAAQERQDRAARRAERRRNRRRFPWLGILIGLALGVAGGLYYAWQVNPVQYRDIAPNQLSAEDQRSFILLVSQTYLREQDVARARVRLSWLGANDPAALVADEADSAFLSGADPAEIRALTVLAEALGAEPQAAAVFSGTFQPTSPPATVSPTPDLTQTLAPLFAVTPTITPTPEPIATFTPTPAILVEETEFELVSLLATCRAAGLISLLIFDENGEGVPAIEVRVSWGLGTDSR
ncbi:MAG: hypothetical protein GYB68_13525, partial [Chloroflexi bacterium]|nr:hypothetical protein [Chloroflexota bacterium]